MDEQLSKLKNQIDRIEPLKFVDPWGPEFQLWERTTKKIVKDVFGQDGEKLFDQQQTVAFSSIDDDFNHSQYVRELEKRKIILEGLMDELQVTIGEGAPETTDNSDILKKIWKSEEAIRENLLKTIEVQPLQDALVTHLEKTLKPDSIPGLRFRKIKDSGKIRTWWSAESGYPAESPWSKFEPFLDLLAQHEAEKTIKHRLETEGLFVESRSRGEDQHLLIGERDGSGEKAHLIIDGKSGEIRTEDNRKEATDLVARVETILTLPSGKKIRTTREAVEEIAD